MHEVSRWWRADRSGAFIRRLPSKGPGRDGLQAKRGPADPGYAPRWRPGLRPSAGHKTGGGRWARELARPEEAARLTPVLQGHPRWSATRDQRYRVWRVSAGPLFPARLPGRHPGTPLRRKKFMLYAWPEKTSRYNDESRG